jgi:SnoaL-like domain
MRDGGPSGDGRGDERSDYGRVGQSPIEEFLGAVDRLELDAIMALMAPEVRVLVVDGRRAEGIDAVRQLFADFLGQLRATTHRITAEWHEDEVWIAGVDASYELRDWLQLNGLPRAFIVRAGPDGVCELNAYGAHEHQLSNHPTGGKALRVGGRWVPPL